MKPKTIELSLLHAMIDQAVSRYPYKVPGCYETYDKYNEGWSDGLDMLSGLLYQYEHPDRA